MDANSFSRLGSARDPRPGPPYVGALLRLCWRRVRCEIEGAVRQAGFLDLPEPHLTVFSYPLPDGVRPSDLARQIGMSRQATNHTLSQLELLGYVERRASEPMGRRLVYLTDRGWLVADTILAALANLQEQWAEAIGKERFADFMNVLRDVAEN